MESVLLGNCMRNQSGEKHAIYDKITYGSNVDGNVVFL